jgi:hypothetical protein
VDPNDRQSFRKAPSIIMTSKFWDVTQFHGITYDAIAIPENNLLFLSGRKHKRPLSQRETSVPLHRVKIEKIFKTLTKIVLGQFILKAVLFQLLQNMFRLCRI